MIRVATDFSGIEAPIQALKKLKVNFSHEWCCDNNKYVKESILTNYNPKIFFDDIRKKRVLPDIDMYIAGFPCQPFSMAGKRKGKDDDRGQLVEYCIDVIKRKKPRVFVLENVEGLVFMKDYFEYILNSLPKYYKIYWKILNTRDYGIPQNRKRVYIVGILNPKREFQFPRPKKCKELIEFIDRTDTIEKKSLMEKRFRKLIRKSKEPFVNFGFQWAIGKELYVNYCPTLDTHCNMWNSIMNRRINVNEGLMLQGFPINFKRVVSDTQMKKQIGNSMSVNVLVELFKEIFKVL